MTTPPRRGRLRPTRIAAAVLLLLPIVEIFVLIQVGQAIGALPTFLLLVAMCLLGAWIIRREGGRAWRALNTAVQSGRMPARELADGIVVLVGGALLLIPGFVTDVVGLILVLPFTRPAARRIVQTVIAHRIVTQSGYLGMQPGFGNPVTGPGSQPGPGPMPPRRTSAEGDIIEGEIIDE